MCVCVRLKRKSQIATSGGGGEGAEEGVRSKGPEAFRLESVDPAEGSGFNRAQWTVLPVVAWSGNESDTILAIVWHRCFHSSKRCCSYIC